MTEIPEDSKTEIEKTQNKWRICSIQVLMRTL